MNESKYPDLLPDHKQIIKEQAKTTYGLDISAEDIETALKQKHSELYDFHRAQQIRREIVVRKMLLPILNDARKKAGKKDNAQFELGFMGPYFFEAVNCFESGLVVATIFLCRSALEVGLREVIAQERSNRNGTSLLDEYNSLEKAMLGSGKEGGLLKIAEKMNIIKADRVNRTFTPLHRLAQSQNPEEYRRLLDKFIHGSYSDLFFLVRDISFDGSHAKDYKEFIGKLDVVFHSAGLGLPLSIGSYFHLLRDEETAFYFMQSLFEFAKLIYFERPVLT